MSNDTIQLENLEFVQSCSAQFRCRRCSSLDSTLQRARCGHGFCGRCTNLVRASRFQCPVDSRSVEKKEQVQPAVVQGHKSKSPQGLFNHNISFEDHKPRHAAPPTDL